MKTTLTQKIVNSLTATGTKQRLSDSKVGGLLLRIAPAGKKTWVIRYRSLDGTSREMKIGDADKLPLENARHKARQELANVPTGGDPLEEHREAKREALIGKERTLVAITKHYRSSSNFTEKRKNTQQTYNNSLDNHILPRIGDRLIASLKRGDISSLLEDIQRAHSGNVSNQARSALSVVLSYSVERDIIDYNPMRGIKAKHKTPRRVRILTDGELKGLWEAAKDTVGVSPTIADMLSLLMLVPARSQEIAGMRWSELDLTDGIWRVPADRMKGGEPHELPLGEQAVSLLSKRSADAKSEWVFPNKAGDAAMSRQRPSRACNRLAKQFGWDSFGPHDLRRTIATRLAGLEFDHATIERTLGHKVGAGKAIINYDHHNYRNRKRKALLAWEAELMTLISNKPESNIYRLRNTSHSP